MNSTSLLYAFSAGMVAAINPCGFALLPAYLSYYLGLESATPEEAAAARGSRLVGRALAVGAAMTLGFVVVFGIIGAVWSTVSSALGSRLPWVVVGVGVVMIGFGVAMLRGFVPIVRLPKLATTSGSQSVASSFVFGVSYGVASLSCAIAPFIAAVTTTFRRHSVLDGLSTLVAYALGMGAIICILTLAVSLARQGIVNRLRSLMPRMGRISGVLLVLSGILAVYYGWYEASVLTSGAPDSAFGRTVQNWRTSVQEWIGNVGEERIGLAVLIVVCGAAAIAAVLRRPADESAPATVPRETSEASAPE